MTHLRLVPKLDGLAHRRGKAAVPPPSAVVALVWGGEPSSSAHRLPSRPCEVCDMPVPDYGCPACGGDEAA